MQTSGKASVSPWKCGGAVALSAVCALLVFTACGAYNSAMEHEKTTAMPAVTAKATFGAGCFWGVEEAFRTTPGVVETAVGYAGGQTERPTYEAVCSDDTGHAEVVQVTYDPAKVSYEQLLDVFWGKHDPTQVNRQGPDVGDQYRSVIFYHDDSQRQAAEAAKQRLDASGKLHRPVATQIAPAPQFWRAEEYHQKYLAKRGMTTCKL